MVYSGSGFGLIDHLDPDPTQQLGHKIKISFIVYNIEVYEINDRNDKF
jgi:hypothetical protein